MFMRERSDKAALLLQPLEHEAGDVPGVGRRGVGRCRGSVERLYLHEPVIVVAPDPERRRRRRLVDEHGAHVGVGRHQVLHCGSGLGIEAHDPVGMHRRDPELAVPVEIGPVRIRAGR